MAGRAKLDALGAAATGGGQRSLGREPEVDPAPAGHLATEAPAEARRHLLRNLETAWSDRRPEYGLRPARPEGPRDRLDHAPEQSAPARMHQGQGRTFALGAGDRDR